MDTIRFTAKEREFVYGVAMKYMKDEEKAHDVTQDALLLAYRHRQSFRGDSRFTTWLYRIAATTALMHLRKDRRLPLMTSIDGAPANDDGGPLADEPRDEASTPEDSWASSEAVAIAGPSSLAAVASIEVISGTRRSLRRCIKAVVAAMRYSQVVKRESPRKLSR